MRLTDNLTLYIFLKIKFSGEWFSSCFNKRYNQIMVVLMRFVQALINRCWERFGTKMKPLGPNLDGSGAFGKNHLIQ